MKEGTITYGYKVCSRCKERKPLSEFYVSRTSRDGHHNYCRDCSKEYQKEKLAQKRQDRKKRVCPRCGKEKPLVEFGRDASRADGMQSCCKACAREKTRICRAGKAEGNPSGLYNKGVYERNRAAILAGSMKSYYTTDYLEKKYLKRYRASLEKAMAKRDVLLRAREQQGVLSRHKQKKLDGYLDAIGRWKEKIAEMEGLIDTYILDRKKDVLPPEDNQKQEQEPTTANDMEKQKPKAQTLTKKDLMERIATLPDDARIIHVGDTDDKCNLVAVWKTDKDNLCIRNIGRDMPYIISDGPIYHLFSASLCAGEEESPTQKTETV